MEYYNFQSIFEALPSRIEELVHELYPQGKKNGAEYRLGGINGEVGNSFAISLKPHNPGFYQDFADPSVRGNAVALVAHAKNLGYQEAGTWLAEWLGLRPEMSIPRRPHKKPVIDKKGIFPLTEKAVQFALTRGIEKATLETYRCASSKRYPPEEIVMPHYDGTDLGMLKFWSCDDTKNIFTNENPVHCLFGKHLINPLETGGVLLITEGQWDAMSWWQTGYPAVSIPSGASNDHWIENDWVFLSMFSEILLDFDNDPAGMEAEERVRSRLGYERVKFVRYRFKDANEALQASRGDLLEEAYDQALNAPIQCIVEPARIKEQVRKELNDDGENEGVPFFIESVPFRFRPHCTTLWVGKTGHGKSTAIMNQLVYQAGLGVPSLLGSFEDPAQVNYANLLLMFSNDAQLGCDPRYDLWYDQLTRHILLYDSLERASPDKFIATMVMAHKQLGICHFALDNVMTLSVDRQDNTAQAAVADALRVFVGKYPVHLHLAAHPRKPQDNFNKPPGTEDVRGASEWADMAQNIITVFRDGTKDEKLNELIDSRATQQVIDEFRNSCPDGKFIWRKHRKNGRHPICTFRFDTATKRFWKNAEDLSPHWYPGEPADQDGYDT